MHLTETLNDLLPLNEKDRKIKTRCKCKQSTMTTQKGYKVAVLYRCKNRTLSPDEL